WSGPRVRGDGAGAAAGRRVGEELGVAGGLASGFFARYQAGRGKGMHENEFVYIYFGGLESAPRPDPAEIADIAHLSFDDIGRRIARDPHAFTFWFKHYVRNHGAEIARLTEQASRLPAM